MTEESEASVPTAKERKASSAPQWWRRLREFAYAHHAIHPGPGPPRC